MAAYSVSKRGIAMLREGTAGDLSPYGIRVNAIAPGGVETEMMRYVWAVPERLESLGAKMPLINALMPPSSCADVVLFLASDLAACVTGQTIVVDAGLTVSNTG